MFFKQIYEEKLAQYAYLIGCQQSDEAIVIDPMRDIDRYRKAAEKEGLNITAAADTHIHADYLTGLREFAEAGIKVYVSGEGGDDWKYEWLKKSDYRYRLLKGGDRFTVGSIRLEVRHTPGHTPEHISFLVTDGAGADAPMGILTGDFVFVGDVGRPDLLESAAGMKGAMITSAKTLYKSVREFRGLPEYLRVWPGHGAGSACGRSPGAVPESTVGYELRFNPSIAASDSEEHFVNYILEGQPEPPLYFARMKRDNRKGPPLLGELPVPRKKRTKNVVETLRETPGVLLDTRGRDKYMKAHLPGSLLVPFDDQFTTTAGSYLRGEEQIYLVIDGENLEEAVRDLVRIGLDNIGGYIPAGEHEAYLRENEVESIDTINFEQAAGLSETSTAGILDVRSSAEYEEGHIKGAVNISHIRLPGREAELSKEKSWLVHCKSGRRASVASAFLSRSGYDVKYIDDRIDHWFNRKQDSG